nr:MAG TPA: hypothetical protein [Caudoviricetes sp.]
MIRVIRLIFRYSCGCPALKRTAVNVRCVLYYLG